MWADSDFETRRGSVRPEDPLLATASGMRARQFRRILSRAWKAMHSFVRRQLSPYRRVKLPPSTV